ncbi:hypothetical protein [Streptomyces shenzhenensis]|uniref:hypothetical protein n=1 Tax=Streptomyces shenzhenensis TaxID=943815 RepID=UPI001F3A9740|nr:hypothetical protein [Streptomyces shenzhenensis]
MKAALAGRGDAIKPEALAAPAAPLAVDGPVRADTGTTVNKHLGLAPQDTQGMRTDPSEQQKGQVTWYVTWPFPEPLSGFEPETYALRDRERSCCVVPGRATE